MPEATPGTPILELESIRKSFGSTPILKGIALSVRRGEFLTLLGPSGCGKTTTLRIIAGFETPDSGQVRLSGRDVAHEPPYRRDVHTVFQHYALFPHHDVFGNVAFGLRIQKLAEDEIKRRVSESLALVKLSGFENRRTHQLSGGQMQRVALARAIAGRPSLLLLDEPLGALDLKLRKAMQLELKAIQRESGITFIYVTHDQEEAMTMSDRIAVFNLGEIVQLGAPADIYERPSTSFVADFIGSANLLTAEVSSGPAAQWKVNFEGEAEVLIPASPAGQAPLGRRRVALRPERIVVRPLNAPPVEGTVRLKARLEDSVFLGSSSQLFLSPFPRSGRRLMCVSLETSPEELPRPGSEVWAEIEHEDILILEAAERELPAASPA